jgi:hypothetical protein
MLKYLTLFLFLILFTNCKILHRKKSYSFEGGGSYIQSIDSISKKDIQIIHFTHSIGVIFPATFGEKIFNSNTLHKSTFFTPDSNLIRKVDKEVNYQHCFSADSHYEKYFGHLFHGNKADSINPILSSDEKEIINEISLGDCLYWQRNSTYYDKQYIGYISATGHKVIYIKLIDFREDPHKLKPLFFTSWIDGWHGWFYSNIYQLYFDVTDNKLMFTGDI